MADSFEGAEVLKKANHSPSRYFTNPYTLAERICQGESDKNRFTEQACRKKRRAMCWHEKIYERFQPCQELPGTVKNGHRTDTIFEIMSMKELRHPSLHFSGLMLCASVCDCKTTGSELSKKGRRMKVFQRTRCSTHKNRQTHQHLSLQPPVSLNIKICEPYCFCPVYSPPIFWAGYSP